MSAPRLALVTRRFWPLVDDQQRLLGNLADALNQRGATTTVVTAQWRKSWPRECVHRETPVVRLPKAPAKLWGTVRFMLALSRWLRTQRDEFDLAYVASMRYEAHVAVGALAATGVPVVLRCDSESAVDDCRWQQQARIGRRIAGRCQAAAAVIANTQPAAEQLVVAGYNPNRIHKIADGVVPPMRSTESRRAARAVLAESHPVLMVGEKAPLVVCTGPIDHARLPDLVAAWPAIVERRPDARLWLVGSFAKAARIWETIESLGLKESVILPGAFDDYDDLITAADILIDSRADTSGSLPVLAAMSAGLPVIAADTPANRVALQGGTRGQLVADGDHDGWSRAMTAGLSDRSLTDRLASAAKEYACKRHGLAQMVDAHLALFQELVKSKAADKP